MTNNENASGEWLYLFGGNPVESLELLSRDSSPIRPAFGTNQRSPPYFFETGLELDDRVSPLISFTHPDFEMLGLASQEKRSSNPLYEIIKSLEVGVPTSQLLYTRGDLETTDTDLEAVHGIKDYLIEQGVPFVMLEGDENPVSGEYNISSSIYFKPDSMPRGLGNLFDGY